MTIADDMLESHDLRNTGNFIKDRSNGDLVQVIVFFILGIDDPGSRKWIVNGFVNLGETQDLPRKIAKMIFTGINRIGNTLEGRVMEVVEMFVALGKHVPVDVKNIGHCVCLMHQNLVSGDANFYRKTLVGHYWPEEVVGVVVVGGNRLGDRPDGHEAHSFGFSGDLKVTTDYWSKNLVDLTDTDVFEGHQVHHFHAVVRVLCS